MTLHSLTLELLADTHGDARLRAWQDRFRAAMAAPVDASARERALVRATVESLDDSDRHAFECRTQSENGPCICGRHDELVAQTFAHVNKTCPAAFAERDSLRAALADSQRISAVEAMGRELEAEREKVAQHVEAMLRYEDGDAVRESRAATAKAINERDEARAALAALHAAASEFREAERDYQYGSGNRAARNSRYCTAADGLRDALRDLAPLAAAHDAEVAAKAREEAHEVGRRFFAAGIASPPAACVFPPYMAELGEFLRQTIARAREEGREEAAASARAEMREEAARVCDEAERLNRIPLPYSRVPKVVHDVVADEMRIAASAIRALAGSSAKGEAGEELSEIDKLADVFVATADDSPEEDAAHEAMMDLARRLSLSERDVEEVCDAASARLATARGAR